MYTSHCMFLSADPTTSFKHLRRLHSLNNTGLPLHSRAAPLRTLILDHSSLQLFLLLLCGAVVMNSHFLTELRVDVLKTAAFGLL